MSTRYNTGNPIESTDVRDMSDNAKNFDDFANSKSNEFTDRFGVERKTIHGMNSEFNSHIFNMGFARIGTFTAGATLTNPRQTLLWDTANGGDGQEYGWSGAFPLTGKVVPPNSTPLTTGGIAVGAWMSRFDPELRIQVRESLRRSYTEAGYNLVDGSFEAGGTVTTATDVLLYEAGGKAYSWGGALPKTVPVGSAPSSSGGIGLNAWTNQGDSSLRNRISASVDNIANLRSINRFSFQRAFVSGYYAPGDGGGGSYWYDPTDTSSSDNGGSIIVASDGGRWKLALLDSISVLQFGAKPNIVGVDNSPYFNAALSYAATVNKAVTVPAGAYYVSNSIILPTRGSLIGTPSSWAYGNSGYFLKSAIIVNTTNSFAALQPVIDARTQRQTTIMWIDIDGNSANVCCLEYGARTNQGANYNNHQYHYNVFRNATYGVRANYTGLFNASYNQFTYLTDIGLYSEFSMSDSTFISNYWNNIGSASTSTDPYNKVGVGIWLGANAGNAFIGGKVEWCRVGFTCIGTSYFRAEGLWLDNNTFTHFMMLGDSSGPGRNNSITGCVISGGASLAPDSSAIDIRGYGFNMSVSIVGGAIKALNDALLDVPADPTYGPRLSAVKSLNNLGTVSVYGTDMLKCSKLFGVYLDGTGSGAKCIDYSVCDLPNSVAGGAVRNGYSYDAGGNYLGITLRNAESDAAAAASGITVGTYYRNGNAVKIRLA